jgi:hypothetical protein
MSYLNNMLLFSAVMCVFCLCSSCTAGHQDEINVNLWYGQEQYFGQWGNTQRQINILGSIQGLDTDCRVYYRLNGRDEKVDITLGSDLHRLAMEGDFNLDIDRTELKEGENHIRLYMERRGNAVLVETIRIHYTSTNTWPIPYNVDWSQVKRIQDAVEVVDGYWEITPAGVRIKEQYYDRILAFGDSSWLDYEVETSVIFHDYIAPAEGPPTYNVSHVAIASRWPGHDQDSLQPDRKWFPLGATSEFRITDEYDSCRWRIFDGENFYVEQELVDYRTIQAEKAYRLKHRVENISDSVVQYSVKFWPADEQEPEQWDLQALEKMTRKESGSALLLAHNTEVTFGNIYVRAVGE